MITRDDVMRGSYGRRPLEDVVEFLDHLRKPVTARDRTEGRYPYYGANGQQGTTGGYIFDEPLVLLAEDGGHFEDPERGVAYSISGRTWVNNHAHVLRPKSGLDLRFLTRVLENYDLRPFVSGTTRGKLTKSSATQIPIPIPPYNEQRRIAAILDHADAIRSKRRQARAGVERLAESIFGEAMLGADFELGTVADTADVQGGLQITPKRKSLALEVPYLRVANVYRNRLDLSEIKTMRVTDDELLRTRLRTGDVLIVEGHGNREEVGRAALWTGAFSDCVHQNHLIRIRFDPGRVIPEFATAWLNSSLGRQHLLRSAKTTSGLNTISASDVKSASVPLLAVGLQERFVQRMDAVRRLASSFDRTADEIDGLFASLQAWAFVGRA